IKSAADLISEETPDYQYLAARLAVFHLRKKAYGQYEPPTLFDHVSRLVDMGKYDQHILEDYSKAELDELDSYIDHKRDLNFSYAAVKQLEGKYFVQNRVSGEIYESAQFLYILVSACLFANYPKETRLDYIKRFYDATSTFKISLPTPIMSGVRTPTRQFSSCVLIECGDSLDSINATASSIVRYVSQRAGIGINAGRIRALGSEIRGGEAFHTGCIPFYKYFQTAVKCCSQGGVRGGAATVFYPMWHGEARSLMVLKNNRGVEENRVRHMDYGVQLNKLMYQRLVEGGNITLFSPSDVPGLYDAFFENQEEFERLYVKYENDPSVKKETVKAIEMFSLLMQERASTGRIYIQNVDHCNTHSPFDSEIAPVRQSNLCLEIALPTKPLTNVEDD
ncbi:ribonucleoside-diphosphate reductase subunit alpha, partial [Vibrio parahaemolyticus]|nr:ribonucleoside-diphosphate reductase subunit alpha [Vibrio parahaemolyticus]